MPENPQVQHDDPVTSKSLAMPILVSSALLMLSLGWAVYDEMVALRPWRGYQREFAKAYSNYLQAQIPKQQELEQSILNSADYQKIKTQLDAAVAEAKPKKEAIAKERDYIRRKLLAIGNFYQEKKALIGSYIYKWEIASERSKKSWDDEIRATKAGPYKLHVPQQNGDGFEEKSYTFDELEREFLGAKERQAELGVEEAAADRLVSDLSKQLQTYFDDRMVGLTPSQMTGLLNGVKRINLGIRQINVDRVGLVDRCQSCHVAMDPALVPPNLALTKASLGLAAESRMPFAAHPTPELLKVHNPDRFGCSPCHGGNGRATSSVVKGHGRHKYWLWPLFYKENMEAGCQQCHTGDMVTDMAPTLNRGKELYREKGCIGCHRYEGFDNEGEQLLTARQTIRQLTQQSKEMDLEIPRIIQSADRAEDNATAQQLYAKADAMRVNISAIAARVEQLNLKAAALMREEKKVGPSLKEVRMKINRDWIPVWLKSTHDFRPSTKMPMFRLQDDEVQAISAFIWQSGVTGTLQKHAPGDAARGKAAFETRGCMACHSMGEGDKALGGDFAANLSRVGEKDNYDYLVRWIHNPRERTRPYCSLEKRDLGPEDYAKKGLPFVFDLEHSQCPNDGSQLQVQQPTVMPNLRLTVEEARDIATYLMQQKRSNATYAAANFMEDAKLKERGRFLVRNYGCAGCHEIATLEEEGRIGTELTTEGSKPIERLDFALLTHEAERNRIPVRLKELGFSSNREHWYDQKGFFEAKLRDPAIFDEGKFKPNPLDRLKMPKPNVSAEEITALSTLLLGSVDPQYPADFKYRPADQRRDVQEGWWLVTKYNCMGCHQIQPGQQTKLQNLPQYRGENKDKLPPPLLSEGARVDPNWLARFLENPALHKTNTNRNGVREYLQVRMPTFSFSDNEIRKIVRFFEAVSSQAQPYLPPKVVPLTDQERTLARALFTHPAAPCLKCHATGVPSHDANATAPNFLLASERLRPAWTTRWLLDPAKISPGTAMPSGLFRKEGDRWVFAGPQPAGFQHYSKDHAELLVRYMFQLTPEEQRMLVGRSPSSSSGAGAGAGKK